MFNEEVKNLIKHHKKRSIGKKILRCLVKTAQPIQRAFNIRDKLQKLPFIVLKEAKTGIRS